MKTPPKTLEPLSQTDLSNLMSDPILEEVRRTKIKLSERFNHDLHAMVRDARARQAQSGHPIIILPEDNTEHAPSPQG